MNPEEPEKLSELLGKLRDGAITKEQFAQLDQLLENDPQAQEYYVDYILLCSDLRNCQAAVALDMLAMARLMQTKSPQDHLEASAVESPRYIWEDLAEHEKNAAVVEVEKVAEAIEKVLTRAEQEARIRAFAREQKAMVEQERRLAEEARRKKLERELRRRQRIADARRVATKVRRHLRNGAMAAMLMVIGYLLYVIMQPVAPATIATLTDSVNVKWADPDLPTELGSLLGPGSMKLVEGYAQITFDEGAQIIVEAPAEINLENNNRAFLQLGNLSAEVPTQARGFKIDTPSSSIVDVGTKFAVHVAEDGSSDIHVFKGKVSLMARKLGEMIGKRYDTVEQIVEAGQAKRVLAGSPEIQDIQFGETAFVRNAPSPYELAIRQSKPVAYWRFDESSEESDRSIQYFGNSAIESVGPDLGDGKTNYGLKLDGNNSHVLAKDTAPNWAQTGFSLVLWVRPDTTARQNIIFNADQDNPYSNYSRQLFVNSEGKFAFWMLIMEPDLPDDYYPVTLTSSTVPQPDRWYHVAVTVGTDDGLHMFVNGNEENNFLLDNQIPDFKPERNRIYIGSAACGRGDDRKFMRSFTGGLDEIARYNRVLSPGEIRQLYRSVGQ